ncbi:LuxR C-terminal-related transcriptional regulator [Marinobacter sp. 1_MG-2023]|uniref:LuxR C-terminal-related transcriptional regulator n=1 Tax=Marinobacter sp. 1_MG-2023 TaxID=3062627 RepID=UPI0026E2F64A|nr:LuxR C-terminal-related transcriptional regulator [Marinobacter sp. 1_MG-2023]MDO6822734.1 LuxR C-terminal-related transcriptional regulator [Marinobacter sp. 1_MG-2023]
MSVSHTPERVLMVSKLNPPASRAAQVQRAELCHKILSASAAKLVVVRASAGFGKTTAMTQSMSRMNASGVATAWLTIDDADNDVSRFLFCLNASVSRLTDSDDRLTSGEAIEKQTASEAAFNIVARLSENRSAFALFIDDFEKIHEQSVLGLIREIVEHLPAHGQIIVGSRHLPELGLGRLRARGQLLEIDVSELRFSVEETTEFLVNRRQLELSQDDLIRVHNRSEGWATALWLTSLALEGNKNPQSFIQRFSGENDAIADYLSHDVLAQQSDGIKNFLLRTSILRHLTPSLCDALVPGCDSGAMLRHLDTRSAFLAPIEHEQLTYRYHSLFAEFLRAELHAQYPEDVTALHLAASNWYENSGRVVPAIDHAIEGRAFGRAMVLLEAHAGRLLSQGRMKLLARWLGDLPMEQLKEYELLEMIYIWAIGFTRGPDEALEMLSMTNLEASESVVIKSHILAFKPLMMCMMDRYEEASELGRAGDGEFSGYAPFADIISINSRANVFSVMGLYDRARQLIDGARDAQFSHSSSFNSMYSESLEGLIDLQEGRQKQAAARFRLAVGATSSTYDFSHTSGNAWAGVLHANTVYEANNLELAARLLHVYGPLVREAGLPDHMLISDIMLSRLAFNCGDVDRAFQALTELEHLGRTRKLPRVVATARLERSRLFLVQGRGDAAKQELDRAGNEQLWQRVRKHRMPANDLQYIEMARLRWEVLVGDAQSALSPLEQEIKEAQESSLYRRVLKLKLFKAIALYRCNRFEDSIVVMADIMPTCCAEGYVRLFVDEGSAAGMVVKIYLQTFRAAGHQSDPVFVSYLEGLTEAFGPAIVLPPAIVPEVDEPILNSLTRKETRVLQLLSEGYSNSAMAEKLFVSDSTVRTHLRSINSKLNASSRTQAVAIARRHGLI